MNVAQSLRSPVLPLDTSLLQPGMRLGIGLSGGADSVALTRALAARSSELGLVLHIAHLHHGLRGLEADQDQQFAADLAKSLGLSFHTHKVDTAMEADQDNKTRKSRETIEEAARRLRYTWFRKLISDGHVDAVATAHTLDDQVETVLGKFLRGAWTEGFSGIHPVVRYPEGLILRPLLACSRNQIEAYLVAIQQVWREDSSNQDPSFTRNRLRHQLLPELESWNPQIRRRLANLAILARDEEAWWQAEIFRLAPQIILTGRPVRGGGRAVAMGAEFSTVALDVIRLAQQLPAVQRRLLRYATSTLGISIDFDATENLRLLAIEGRSGQRISIPGPITAERSAREVRLTLESRNSEAREPGAGNQAKPQNPTLKLTVLLPIPGEVIAFGLRFRSVGPPSPTPAIVRNWRPGDRVTLRYSGGPRKIKEVLDRLKISGTARSEWPVVEWMGQIVWMQAAELQPTANLTTIVTAATTQNE